MPLQRYPILNSMQKPMFATTINFSLTHMALWKHNGTHRILVRGQISPEPRSPTANARLIYDHLIFAQLGASEFRSSDMGVLNTDCTTLRHCHCLLVRYLMRLKIRQAIAARKQLNSYRTASSCAGDCSACITNSIMHSSYSSINSIHHSYRIA